MRSYVRTVFVFLGLAVAPAGAHAAVLISEIMYDVPASVGADDTREWVEVANTGGAAADLTGWKFNDGANHVLNAPPANGGVGSLSLPAGAVAILADDAATFRSLYPSYAGTVIDTTMSLNNTGATLSLFDGTGASAYSVTYDHTMGAAGDGNSLGWNGSALIPGTPTPGTTSFSGPSAPAAQPAATTPGGSAAYTPPPASLSIQAGTDRAALMDVPLRFSATPKASGGASDSAASVVWSFGDGSSATGNTAEKIYHYAGSYMVTVTAADGSSTARDSFTVSVMKAAARIASVSGEGIVIANQSEAPLDLSDWRLSAGLGIFRMPVGTMLAASSSVLFPRAITGLPVSFDVRLRYPDGMLAAEYAPPPAVQPSAPSVGSIRVQPVESALSSESVSAHAAQTVDAPEATSQLAASGAAVPDAAGTEAADPAPTPSARTNSLLRSPWLLGLFGIMATAGGAFMIL